MNLSRFYAITQIEYCRNFIFKRHFPIHKIFERSLRTRALAFDIASVRSSASGSTTDYVANWRGHRADRPLSWNQDS
jgi:hypothetical protein